MESELREPPDRCGNALSPGPRAPKPCDPICRQGLGSHAGSLPFGTPPRFVFDTTAPAEPAAMLCSLVPPQGEWHPCQGILAPEGTHP